MHIGDRVLVLNGPSSEATGTIAPCDSTLSEHYGEWRCIGEQGLPLVWVVPDDPKERSADPSGGMWRLEMNITKIS